MKPVLAILLVASFVLMMPAASAAEASAEECSPLVRASACPWGTTGVQDAQACGKSVGSVCVPIL